MHSFEVPQSLDVILYPTIDLLEDTRIKIDNVILQFASELTTAAISQPLAYSNTRGQPLVKNVASLLQHFFNHQTHHRGQVSTLLHQAGVDIGITDLLMCIPDEEPDNK